MIAIGDTLRSIGGHFADNVSIGVYKTTDGGTTWLPTGLSFAKNIGISMSRILIDPNNDNILYAATSQGIYKSIDGGAHWGKNAPYYNDGQSSLSQYNYYIIDLEMKPNDSNTIYASAIWSLQQSAAIYKSTDGGNSWYLTHLFTSSDARIELAVTPDDPTFVYALVSNFSGGLSGIYKSTDSGESFFQVNTNTSQNMLSNTLDGTGSKGQGNYDLCIAVSPADKNTIFIGGINTWKSTDGGVSWSINTSWYQANNIPTVHADKHALAFQNNSTILFQGNDGGIYKTTDSGTNWIDKTNGMVLSQIYRISVSQTIPSVVLTGLQDNGSKVYAFGVWEDVNVGDGMECIIDYSNPQYCYTSQQNGPIYRSTNNFDGNYIVISSKIPGGQPSGAWVTPYIIDQNNPQILYAGYDKVWKTIDRGDTWTSISSSLSSSDKLRSLAISPSNSNYIYASDLQNIWRTTDGGASWYSITGTLPVNIAPITYITVSATDPNTLWITMGGYSNGNKVFQSTDSGNSWTNITGDLPNLPVMCIVQNKRITNRYQLFVGTDIGVYAKDGSNDWINFSDGLPNVVTTELEFHYDGGGNTLNDRLVAGTYGRGLWETIIAQPLPVEITEFNGSAGGSTIHLSWQTATEVNNYGFDIERKVLNTSTNAGWQKIGFVKGNGTTNSSHYYSFSDENPIGGLSFEYRLKQIDNNNQFQYYDAIEVKLNFLNEVQLLQNSPNPFNPTTAIKFFIPNISDVTIKIYDMLGKEVVTLINRQEQAGYHIVYWNGKDESGSSAASGTYIYRIQAGNFDQSKKMILLK